MNHIQSIKSICLLVTGAILGTILLPGTYVDAQCVNRQSPSVPMWEIYGMNPFQPRVKSSVQFTPLQGASNCPPQMALRLSNRPSLPTGEIYLGEVLASEVPAGAIIETVPGGVATDSEIAGAKIEVEVPSDPNSGLNSKPIEETEVGSIPSPSDILIASPKTIEPTPADESTRVSSAELREARAEIERLTVELEAAKEKARTAVDRAYAAEKAAVAAAKNAELKLMEVQKMAADQEASNSQSLQELDSRNRKLDEMEKQFQKARRELENVKNNQLQQQARLKAELVKAREQAKKALEKIMSTETNAPRTTKPKRAGGARELVEQLEAAAKSQPTAPKQPRQPKVNALRNQQKKQAVEKAEQNRKKAEKANADEAKKSNRGQFNAEKQIKQLNESMQRQIETSSKQITRRNQTRIDKLLGEGKKESDPEVLETNQKLKAELEENEAKIRARIEERIQRIRKEAAARARS